jgi:hypothetical protein
MTLKIFYRDGKGGLVPTTCQEIARLEATVHRGRDDDSDRLDGRNDTQASKDFASGMTFQKEVNFLVEKVLLASGLDAAMALTHPDAVDSTADIEIYLPATKRRIYIEIQTARGWFDYRSRNDTYYRVIEELDRRYENPFLTVKTTHAYACLRNIEAMADPVGIHVKGLKAASMAAKGDLYLLQQVGHDTFVVKFQDIIEAPRSPMPWPKDNLNYFLSRDFLEGQPSFRSFMDKLFPKRTYNR